MMLAALAFAVLQTQAAQQAPRTADVVQLRQAAEMGDAAAAYGLGVAYRDGLGLGRDVVLAAAWLSTATLLAPGGEQVRDGEAILALNRVMTLGERAEANPRTVEVLERIAATGHARARFLVGCIRLGGDYDTTQDVRQAFEWMRQAASQGHADAQWFLALMYRQGRGAPQDDRQAAQWFRQAADQGLTIAQFSLATMYSSGSGVAEDKVEAHKWLNLAAARASGENARSFADARDSLAAMLTPRELAEARGRASDWLDAFDKRSRGITGGDDRMILTMSGQALASAGNRASQAQDYRTAIAWYEQAILAQPDADPAVYLSLAVNLRLQVNLETDRLKQEALVKRAGALQAKAEALRASSAGTAPAFAPPPPPPPPSGAVRVGGDIPAPTQLKKVAPVYPTIAQAARVQGVVILEATIGPDGRVQDLKILRSIPLLDQAAIDAVKQWEFAPTLLNNIPVPVVMTVTVNFTLQ